MKKQKVKKQKVKKQKVDYVSKLSRKVSIVFHGLFKRRAYLKSNHADDYEEIASNNDVYPGYVYALAHCQKRPLIEDYGILKELRMKSIIV